MAQSCCNKYYLVSALALSVFTWAMDFLIHGVLFADLYTPYAGQWRSMEEMQSPLFFVFCMAYHVLTAALVTGGFFHWRRAQIAGPVGVTVGNCPYKIGMKFGLWLGLLFGIGESTLYMFLPIGPEMAVLWFAANVVKWSLAGFVLAHFYRWKEKGSAV